MIGRTLSHFEITAKLGEGGMGRVYRATDKKLGREVAIKVLSEAFTSDPNFLARFEREARVLASLNHPGIAQIYGLETAGEVRALVMELVEGPTLAERLEQGALRLEECLSIGLQMVEALGEAHEKGIIHRDLKPQNIKLTEGGKVKILDFGLAKRSPTAGLPLGEATTEIDRTRAGTMLGTVGYMAPEQVRGESLDRQADLFAFGCVLHELLTGEQTFARPTPIGTLSAILHEEPPPASQARRDVPPNLDHLIARCLEKDPERRFQSCREVLAELARVAGQSEDDKSGPVPSLAVLPFVDISAEHDQDYFCDGMAEELLSSLSRLEGLRVASRTSSFQFKDVAADAREIGKQLRVGAILEGSVRKSGSRLRITVQLSDSESGYQLWSERFDRELEDVFEIQDEIARRIVEALQVRLVGGEFDRQTASGAPDAHAYDLYLRGRSFFYRGTRHDFEFAQELFQQAIELDAQYASPWAGIADCSSQIFREFDRRPEHLKVARAAAARALELDPESAHAYSSLGFARSLAGERLGAEEAFQKAMRLDPRLFDACYLYASEMLYGWGDLERAATLFERAAEVDSNDYQSLVILASVYHGLDRPADARDAARRGVQLAESRLRVNPGDLRALYLGAEALVVLGDEERAVRMAERARELDGGRTSLVFYNVAAVLAMIGRRSEAIDHLEKAVAKGHGRANAFRFDPFLIGLRDQPRFQELLERMEPEPPN